MIRPALRSALLPSATTSLALGNRAGVGSVLSRTIGGECVSRVATKKVD